MSLLLCDDHHMFLDALTTALTARGHDVVAVTDNPLALPDLVDACHPDGCVVDVRFHGRPQLGAVAELRRRAPGIPVLLLTGACDAEVRAAYDTGLVDGVVNKACDVAVLDAALRRILAGGRAVEGCLVEAPRARPAVSSFDQLTDREQEVLAMITHGASTEAMALTLGVSTNTVRTHVQNVLNKLGVHHRTKAAALAFELGLVPACG
jgi:two-component system, NarL family, nitrate/nitrite response regulator NarL